MTSAVAFRRFPPLPTVPEAFRGRVFAALRGCWCGPDLGEGARLVTAARAALGPRGGRHLAGVPTRPGWTR